MTWAPTNRSIELFARVGRWQPLHELSLACGPAGWFLPVVQSMLSWQEPHAARLGAVFPVVGVRCARLVARGAVANLLRESNVGKIGAVDKERLARNDAGKTGAAVNLVHHHFEIDSAAAIGRPCFEGCGTARSTRSRRARREPSKDRGTDCRRQS